MNKFLYLISILSSCITFSCLGEGHTARAGFKFYNSLEEKVTLKSKSTKGAYTPEGFKSFEEQEISSGECTSFEEDLTNYEELKTLEDPQVMLDIDVLVKDQKIGSITFKRTIRPAPMVVFETVDNPLDLQLRIKRSRFGGGPRTIEIVRTADR